MNEKELSSLQPLAQTAPEIHAALARIAGAKTSAQSRARDAQAELDERARGGTLTSAHRRKLEDAIHDQQQDAVMLDVLATQTEAPLSAVEESERDARLAAERAALRAEMAEADAKWETTYPALHEALASLLAERRDLLQRLVAHNDAAERVFRPVQLTTFQIPTTEVRLIQTPEERAEAALSPYQRELRSVAAVDAARREAVAARGPIVVHDKPPMPTLTVGGVPQDITGSAW